MSGTGALAAARDFVRAVAVPSTGESKAQAKRRAAAALNVSERVLERLFWGEEGVSPLTAHAVLANRKGVVRAKLTQAEVALRALEREIADLKRLDAELGEGGWGETAASGCALGGGSRSASACSGGGAPAPAGSAACSRGPAGGCTNGRATCRGTSGAAPQGRGR